MNPRFTIGLTAIALVLFGYIVLVEWRQPGRGQGQPQAAKLLPAFDPFKVTSVEVTRTNQTIRAERINQQWQLVNPTYPAQSTAIESLLRALGDLNRLYEISAQEIISESGGLSPFGLDPPWASVKIQEGTNLVQFRVGAKTLLGDRVYVQPQGASGICATAASVLEHIPVSAHQWRNPLLMHGENLAFDRILTSGASTLKLERDSTNQLWRVIAPIQMRADFGQVENLLRELRTARISQFITDNPKADLEAYGLQTPEAELILANGTNPVFHVQFGKSPTNAPTQVYARQMAYSNVVLVSRDLAELAKKPYTEFRDRVLLTFRPGSVDRIEAQVADEQGPTPSSNEVFTVQRQPDSWQIVEPFQAPADRELMQVFLEDLARLEIIRVEKEVVTDFAPYGLVKPLRQYALKSSSTNALGSTNQLLVQVDFGGRPTNEPDKVYCRRSDEKFVYVVASPDMGRLSRAAFVLRDRRIWNFASTNVTAISISQRGQKRELVRDAATKSWLRDDQVGTAAIEETLHRLGALQADSWVARGQDQAKLLKTDGSEYQLVLDVNQGGALSKLTLNLRLGLSGQPYAAVKLEEQQLVTFKFPASLYGMI